MDKGGGKINSTESTWQRGRQTDPQSGGQHYFPSGGGYNLPSGAGQHNLLSGGQHILMSSSQHNLQSGGQHKLPSGGPQNLLSSGEHNLLSGSNFGRSAPFLGVRQDRVVRVWYYFRFCRIFLVVNLRQSSKGTGSAPVWLFACSRTACCACNSPKYLDI